MRDKYKCFRYMEDIKKLLDFQNLYNSYKVSLKGKGKKKSAAKFSIMALENLCLMKRQIINRTYKISPYNEFIVSEPKKRVIKSGSFRDKVLQHCLCDYVLLPKMKDIFIKDNYAGQIGKGTLFGLNRLSENLSLFYEKYGYDGFILKCDITKFFYSINHKVMKEAISHYFSDDSIQWVCNLFIDSVDGDGLPLGNQCSQVFALIYLTGLDYFITETLGCKYYGRYMDDFYLISDNKEYLQNALNEIKTYLKSLHLTLNHKTEIVPLKKGIRFLGFHTYITEKGKVIRKLTGDNKRQIKKRLRKYVKLIQQGKMTRKEFNEKYEAWKNHASHGNCYKLICSMDKFVEELFEEKKMEKRIIIAGSRDFNDYDYLKESINQFIETKENICIISGAARGADTLGEKYAEEYKLKLQRFIPKWDKYGRGAGYKRNLEMLEFATQPGTEGILIAFWDGKSKGTKHMIDSAKRKGIIVKVFDFQKEE